MKRWLCAILLCMVAVTCLAACEEPSESAKAYQFTKNSVSMTVDADVAPTLAALGAWTDYYETASCFFAGKDKIYTYAGFELFTYPDGGVDRIYRIRLYDDTVATEEGVRIGDARETVLAAYGEASESFSDSLLYRGDHVYLEFFLENGVVVEIQYQNELVRNQ